MIILSRGKSGRVRALLLLLFHHFLLPLSLLSLPKDEKKEQKK